MSTRELSFGSGWRLAAVGGRSAPLGCRSGGASSGAMQFDWIGFVCGIAGVAALSLAAVIMAAS